MPGMDVQELTYSMRPHAGAAVLDKTASAWAIERDGDSPLALDVAWARNGGEVCEAQRLRHRVFAQEMGARLSPPPGTPPDLDVDAFDAHCEHLIVWAYDAARGQRRAVGTYRALTPGGALRTGGLYTDNEFDLAPLDALRPQLLELGRSCIDAEFRQGGTIMLLWSSLAEFMQRNRLRWMVGCASISMRDGGHAAASLWRGLAASHLAPEAWRVQPRCPLPVHLLQQDLKVEAPPLIKGYLRCGAKLLGPPAWDPDFGTADLPVMLDMESLSPRYRRHFFGTD